MQIKKFEDIESWKEARKLTNKIYEIRKNKVFNSDYALRDQVTRASISIMSNIAEGFDSGSDKMFIRYLNIAYGSSSEVQSLLYVILDQSYIEPEFFEELYEQVETIKNLIGGFIQYLNTRK